MGFNDQEIVALSGAHTLGRAFKERSGTVQYGARAAEQQQQLPGCARRTHWAARRVALQAGDRIANVLRFCGGVYWMRRMVA